MHVRHVARREKHDRLAILAKRWVGLTRPCDDAGVLVGKASGNPDGAIVALLLCRAKRFDKLPILAAIEGDDNSQLRHLRRLGDGTHVTMSTAWPDWRPVAADAALHWWRCAIQKAVQTEFDRLSNQNNNDTLLLLSAYPNRTGAESTDHLKETP